MGELRVVDPTGDSKLIWDPKNEEEVEAAENMFDELMEKHFQAFTVKKDGSKGRMLKKFDPAELYQFEQQRELSITLLKDWLARYKFKDWTETETRKLSVTDAMRRRRAEEIAARLNDTSHWHSHGRGISMEVLQRELQLRISDLKDNPDLNQAVRSYYRLLKDFLGKLGYSDVVHTRQDFMPLG